MINKSIFAASVLAVASTSVLTANTPLLTNTSFDGYDGWIASSNLFVGGAWQANVGTYSGAEAPYQFPEVLTPTGDGFTFSFYDDNASDMLENYLFQEFGAGPLESSTPTVFATGDVIVFKGSASATRSGADTSDMKVRAFIKTLGYNELGWEFQTKEAYTAFHDIGSTLEPFELSVTYPDLEVDDSLQVIQLGFEITGSFDGTAMDTGTIYFENIEGYIEGGATEPTLWAGYEVDALGWINTEGWMGYLNVTAAPWVWSATLAKYLYMPEANVSESGAWVYAPAPAPAN
jgi:hypothetical protein